MGLVDIGKAAQYRLTEMFSGRRIVFHHVPKCGGTSIGRALRSSYILSQSTVTPEESFKAFAAFTNRSDRDQMRVDVLEFREFMLLYLLFSDIRCISAHVPFSKSAYDLFKNKYAFITVLREPAERFVSHYLWSHGRPNAHGRIEEEFEEFLNTPRARLMGATYLKYFVGQPIGKVAEQSGAIEKSIKHVRQLDHVGFLDDMKSSEKPLQQLTGKTIKVGHENTSNKRTKLKELVEGRYRSKILKLCASDLAIWNAVQDLRT